MLNRLFFMVLLIFGSYAYAQQPECTVSVEAISGYYSGGCRNGLAHGKGIARGVDSYEGQFNNGLPEGKGIYKWSNGNLYDGEWKKGLRDGKGKMVYRDSVVSGYWTGNKYQGSKPKSTYKINANRNLQRYVITKSINPSNGIRLKILMGGMDNPEVEDFSIAYSSGYEYQNVGTYCIDNISLPLDVVVRYKTWNQLHTVQYEVLFDFTIFDTGTWNVSLSN